MITFCFIAVELRPSVPLLFAFRDESRTWHSLWFSPGDVPTESALHTWHRGPRRRKKRPKDRATWDSNYFSMSSYTRICLHDSNFKDCHLIKDMNMNVSTERRALLRHNLHSRDKNRQSDADQPIACMCGVDLTCCWAANWKNNYHFIRLRTPSLCLSDQ